MSKRTERNNRRVKPGGPSMAATQMLFILTVLRRDIPIYQGTVPAKVKARRRAANKAAGIARRANRGH